PDQHADRGRHRRHRESAAGDAALPGAVQRPARPDVGDPAVRATVGRGDRAVASRGGTGRRASLRGSYGYGYRPAGGRPPYDAAVRLTNAPAGTPEQPAEGRAGSPPETALPWA